MPDDSTSALSPAKSKHPNDLPTGTYARMLEGNQHAFARWLEGMLALSQEITQFTQVRLQEDMAAWSTLAACNNPEQAFECQRRFAAKMSSQYSEEIAKLSKMMVNIAGDGLASLQQRPAVDGGVAAKAQTARR